MQKILNNHNLLAFVLKYIIDDSISLMRTCKILPWNQAEHLAQHWNEIQEKPGYCEQNACTCSKDYKKACNYQQYYRQLFNHARLSKVNMQGLLYGALYDQSGVDLIAVIWAVKQGACFIRIARKDTPDAPTVSIFDALVDGKSPKLRLKVARLMMYRPKDYLRRFVTCVRGYRGSSYLFQQFIWQILNRNEISPYERELIKVLWGNCDNSLVEEELCLRQVMVKFYPEISKRIEVYREHIISPDTKRVIKVLREFSHVYCDLHYEYFWYYSDSPETLECFPVSKGEVTLTYHSLRYVKVLIKEETGYNDVRWIDNDKVEFLLIHKEIEAYAIFTFSSNEMRMYKMDKDGNIKRDDSSLMYVGIP